MLLLRFEDGFQELPAHIVARGFRVRDGFPQAWHGAHLQGEVATQDFLHVLADLKLAQVLQVRQPFEEEDALHERVRMVHLVDGRLLLALAKFLHAPILEHLGVQEVLVDGREFVLQHGVQVGDDLGILGFHGMAPWQYTGEHGLELARLSTLTH